MQLLSRTMTPLRAALLRIAFVGTTVGTTIAASLVVGCTGIAVLASNQSEYVAYRKVRTSEQLPDRLAASHAYLAQYPDGRWSRDVATWFEHAELSYWKRSQDSEEGLAAYLQHLPKGPHAARATRSLLELRENAAKGRTDQLEASAALSEERLSRWAQQREDAFHAFLGWIARALAIDSWGKVTSRLPHDTIFAWRIDPPRGACVGDVCVKPLQMDYRLPGTGDDLDRVLLMDVALVLDQGMLREVRLQGPALFSRLYEVGTKRAVSFDDASVRRDAVAFVVEVVGAAVEERLPPQPCSIEPTVGMVLGRCCDGWMVRVEVAESSEQDDVVLIRGPDAGRGNADGPFAGEEKSPKACSEDAGSVN